MASQTQNIELAAAGIDVGYHNTKFTLGRVKMDGEDRIAADLFPSVAPLLTNELRADGEIADRDDGFVVRVEGCNYFVGKDVALYVAGQEARALTRAFSQTDKYLALSYGALLSMIPRDSSPQKLAIEHLTVGLPLSTYMEHGAALRDRMQGDHSLSTCTITIDDVHVIPQPQGALLITRPGPRLPSMAGCWSSTSAAARWTGTLRASSGRTSRVLVRTPRACSHVRWPW